MPDSPSSLQSGINNISGNVSHFWASTYPFFQSSINILPALSLGPNEATTSSIYLYDPDGALINELNVQTVPGSVGTYELEEFLGACKIESGLKHGHLRVVSPHGYRHFLRLWTHEGSVMTSYSALISKNRVAFFPMLASTDRTCMIAVVNHSEREANVRCRLYVEKRSPENSFTIPGHGARIIFMDAEFYHHGINLKAEEDTQAYVRLSTLGEAMCSAQFVERVQGAEKGNLYSLVG